jgi:hypothetical protein
MLFFVTSQTQRLQVEQEIRLGEVAKQLTGFTRSVSPGFDRDATPASKAA